MKARPILFSGAMVRALLAGSKTQTRRIVKPQPDSVKDFGRLIPYRLAAPPPEMPNAKYEQPILCPYGVPGDLLIVRESICVGEDLGEGWEPWMEPGDRFVLYPAGGDPDQSYIVPVDYEPPRNAKVEHHFSGTAEHWRQFGPIVSIHMPRWASRLTLEITDVRAQRLQDISGADAICEGVREPSLGGPLTVIDHGNIFSVPRDQANPLVLWRVLWASINGDDSWAANPWCWAVSFKVHQQNVDAFLSDRVAA